MKLSKNAWLLAAFVSTHLLAQTSVQSLEGQWNYRLDANDVGLEEKWYKTEFSETLLLPGSLNTNGIGDPVSVNTPWTGSMWNDAWYKSDFYEKYRSPENTKVVFWLTPDKYYVGKAWYQKKVTVPEDWKDKQITLHLERCHWETTLWVDGKKIGTQNSLAVPHRYELAGLNSGEHLLTLCVDNRIKDIQPGVDAHSVSDNTQSNWNGVVGKMALTARSKAYIDGVRIEPLMNEKKIRTTIRLNAAGKRYSGQLTLRVKHAGDGRTLPEMTLPVQLRAGSNEVEALYDMSVDFRMWDEFQPNVYTLQIALDTKAGSDVCEENFGLRQLGTKGTQITVNGRPVFFRGTLECCIFPKTGFPPTDEGEWKRIMEICQAHGLNHIRFHSWCPPEAAFSVADKLGMYLYVECGAWASDLGSGKPIDDFIYEESRRIVRQYGNHPSFCLMSYGNEPYGEKHKEYLRQFVNYWQERDNRFLYTTAAGWPALDESDWLCLPAPRIQAWGQGVKSIINAQEPNTVFDWSARISKTQPTISHEIGQWCVYPDLKEREKYTGVLKAKNFDIFEDRLRDNGLLHLADSFLLASGKLQTLCYKADIEAALRTKGFGGFQLLDLHDFPGQGSALVGVLNPFWESKGYVTPQEYSEFCNEVVPLVRMPRMIYNSGDTLRAAVEVAQYAASDLMLPVSWRLVAKDGRLMESGRFAPSLLPTGTLSQVGEIVLPLSTYVPQQCQLEVEVGGYRNHWNIWLYPVRKVDTGDVLVASEWNDAVRTRLAEGGKVLLTAREGTLKNAGRDSVVVGFSSIFWNTLWTNVQAPHTLGILCDPHHPALRQFPTSYHSDYQWQDAMSHCCAIPLYKLGNVTPVVRIIDDWFTARSLGMIVELKVGKGSLLLCGADLLTDVQKRPAAVQLMNSLLDYMNSSVFRPVASASFEQLGDLFLCED